MNSGDDVAVVVRHDLLNDVTSEDFLAVDDAWYFEDFAFLSGDFGLQVSTLGASWEVAEYRFVNGGRWARNIVHHATMLSQTPLQHHAM